MSFSKTVSVFAALASIFGASVAGYNLSKNQDQTNTGDLQNKIVELEKKLEQTSQPQVIPQPISLPQPQVQPQVQVAPTPAPPVLTPPPPVPEE